MNADKTMFAQVIAFVHWASFGRIVQHREAIGLRQDCVSVRWRVLDQTRVRASGVVHNHGLSESLAQLLRDDAGRDVEAATRRGGHHDADRLRWKRIGGPRASRAHNGPKHQGGRP